MMFDQKYIQNKFLILLVAVFVSCNIFQKKEMRHYKSQRLVVFINNNLSANDLMIKRDFLFDIDSLSIDEEDLFIKEYKISFTTSENKDKVIVSNLNKIPDEAKFYFDNDPHIKRIKFYDIKISNKTGRIFKPYKKEMDIIVFD